MTKSDRELVLEWSLGSYRLPADSVFPPGDLLDLAHLIEAHEKGLSANRNQSVDLEQVKLNNLHASHLHLQAKSEVLGALLDAVDPAEGFEILDDLRDLLNRHCGPFSERLQIPIPSGPEPSAIAPEGEDVSDPLHGASKQPERTEDVEIPITPTGDLYGRACGTCERILDYLVREWALSELAIGDFLKAALRGVAMLAMREGFCGDFLKTFLMDLLKNMEGFEDPGWPQPSPQDHGSNLDSEGNVGDQLRAAAATLRERLGLISVLILAAWQSKDGRTLSSHALSGTGSRG